MTPVVGMQLELAVLFALAGYWRREFLGLAALTLSSAVLLAVFSPTDWGLYFLRPVPEIVVGLWLNSGGTRLGQVLAATCAATLAAYAVLQFDVVQGTDLIYSDYELVIYAIIAFRLAACANSVYQGIRAADHADHDGGPASPGHRDRMA